MTKKSILCRFAVIVAVLFGWGYSLFPLTDRPFYEVLRNEAGSKIDSRFEKIIEKAKKIDKSNAGSSISPAAAVLNAATESKVDLKEYIPVYNNLNASNREVIDYLRRKAAGKLHLGLDLRGGTEFIVAFDESELKKNEPDKTLEEARDEIIEILRNRIDQSGVVEAEIKPLGDTIISIKIPSITSQEIQRFRDIIQATAKLDFRLVHEDNASLAARETQPDFKAPVAFERMLAEPNDKSNEQPQVLYVKRIPENIGGRHILRAFPTVNKFGSYSVSLQFNNEGARLFHDVTRNNVGRRLAIVLDGTVYSAPNLNEPISGGRAEISGNFTPAEANKLGVVLRCGKLPVPIQIEGEFSTDPTLGRDSVKSGFYAALVGMSFVVVFMIVYYSKAGIIADLALVANILLVLGTLTIAGATVTLPGIAGIVLTIGMAVDANVLIFERIREEINNNKTLMNAVHTGYRRAFLTILDANLTTLLTALILYKFGSGPIRGFAVTLSIGIMASMFTALFMTRAIFDFLIMYDLVKSIKMLNLFRFGNVNLLKFRKLYYVISLILIGLSISTILVRGKSAFNVDFTGGTDVTFNYQVEIPPAEIREALKQEGYDDARVSYKSSAQQETRLVEIVLGGVMSGDLDIKSTIGSILNDRFPAAGFSKGTTKMIGGLVGKRFTRQSEWAAVWALAGIILYITFRFEFAYALGAVAALIHDVIICVGLFLLVDAGGRQLSLPVIAGLLTIIGYSLNDTIVVFDRIRENEGLIKNRNFLDIVNLSISNTLSRTMLTSATTLVVVITLYIYGGGAINDFALVMLVGILVGTYSSIFIASPVMIYWRNRYGKNRLKP